LSHDYTFFPIIRISSIHANAIRKSIRKNAVPVRCFTLIELAFNVETVSVELTMTSLLFRLDTAIVDAVNELPVSVENEVRDRPGTLIADAFNVETVMVELMTRLLACIVDRSEE
jgi:hypothetical protein